MGSTRKKTFGVGDRLLKNSMHEARGCGEDYSHGGGWDSTDAEQGTGEQVLAFRIWAGRKGKRDSWGVKKGKDGHREGNLERFLFREQPHEVKEEKK